MRSVVKFFLYHCWFKYRNPRKYAIDIQNLSIKGDDKNKYVMTFAERGHFDKEVYDKSYFNKTILMEFEKNKFYIPIEYKKILGQNYGEYMKLPPVEQQISNHSINAFIK